MSAEVAVSSSASSQALPTTESKSKKGAYPLQFERNKEAEYESREIT